MKKRAEESEFEKFEIDITQPPSDLWLRHLAVDLRMLGDYQNYLNVMILRAQAHAINLSGPNMHDDLLRLQGGVRVLATQKRFLTEYVKALSEDSGRAGQGGVVGGSNGRRRGDSENARGIGG